MFDQLEKPKPTLMSLIEEIKNEYHQLSEGHFKKKSYEYILDMFKDDDLEVLENVYNQSFDTKNFHNIKENRALEEYPDLGMKRLWSNIKKNHVIQGIKNLSANICPSCEIEMTKNEEKSIEHILPKSKYNQYIMLPLNLVSMCIYCNENKGDNISDDLEKLYHPYYSSINYSIKNVRVSLLKNPDQFQYEYNLDGTLNEATKYNFFNLYSVPTSYRSRFKIVEEQIIESIRNLSKVYTSLNEIEELSKRILEREMVKIKAQNDSNLKYIELITISLYWENFDRFFNTKIKKFFIHLE